MDSPEGATGRKKSFSKVTFLKMDSPGRGNWAKEELFKRSRSMNGVAMRVGELILWGMKGMA